MSDTAETGGSATMSSAVGEPTSVPASGAPSSASSDSSAPQSDSAASADVQRSTSASVSAPAASSTANKPSDAGWPFNSTVEITLNSTAPMLDFDAEGTPFKVEPDTGYRTYADSRSGAAYLRFVGMAYSLNGSAEFRPGSNPDPGLARAPASNKLYNIHRQGKDLRNITVGNNSLGEMSELNLQAYQVDLTFGAWSTISFHNATIQVPIKTQAANFSAMQSQAKTVSAVGGEDISPFMSASVCSVAKDLEYMYQLRDRPVPVFERPAFGPKYRVNEGHLLLLNSTELVYAVPPNTTMVEVLGPSGSNAAWLGDSQCYAFLNPRPSWWRTPNFPVSTSRKAINSTEQSMFILPIDPEIQYEVRVGGLGRETSCPVSAIRTYPFHYDFAADLANTTNSNGTGVGASKPNSTNKTPIIVGVVVGVGGGLLLLALAFLLFRRRRKHREEKEKELLPDPFSTGPPREPRTKAELAQMARGEEPGSSSPPSGDGEEELTAEPRRQRTRRVVQEEDGESIVEYLPPQYREAWQAGPEPVQSPSADSSGDSRDTPSGPSSKQFAAPSTPPAKDLAVDGKARALNPERPSLKQQYARAFGRALPQPPQSASASGSGSANGDQQA